MSEYKTNGARKHESLDAVVIGTGVAGLYQLYKLRDEQGLKVKAVDTATGVGGTWYWNRYPGARFDSEAYIYQYLFSEELYKGWSWSERFPGQPEIEKWLNYVADELDLRKDIRFSTTITSAVFNEATQRWTITTDKGDTIDAQFLITCCGMLSAPLTSVFPGQETFKGTPRPHGALAEGGHGSRRKARRHRRQRRNGHPGDPDDREQSRQPEGVRSHAAVHLPMKNPKYGPTEVEAYKARFKEFRETLPHSFTGFEYDFTNGNWKDLTPEQRHAVLEKIWPKAPCGCGSPRSWRCSSTRTSARRYPSSCASKMRARLKDPKLCETADPDRLRLRYASRPAGDQLSGGLPPAERRGWSASSTTPSSGSRLMASSSPMERCTSWM